MNFNELMGYVKKPPLYALSTNKFWDDEHISKGMLEAHLNPDWDAASRNHEFIDKSVEWIARIKAPEEGVKLLDLGCGPGLYAERFNRAGYSVTGIDFSKRSIEYAKEQAAFGGSNIEYIYQDYLTIDYVDQFDIITMIYCDYAALTVGDRRTLLEKVYRALIPDGKFIFDVFTSKVRKDEAHTWYSSHGSGFFSEEPHICLESIYQYDEDKTELARHVIITEKSVECYNIWNHFFTKEMLIAEGEAVGFSSYSFYGDVVGSEYSEDSEMICGVFVK